MLYIQSSELAQPPLIEQAECCHYYIGRCRFPLIMADWNRMDFYRNIEFFTCFCEINRAHLLFIIRDSRDDRID
jgi:hypothetical protein